MKKCLVYNIYINTAIFLEEPDLKRITWQIKKAHEIIRDFQASKIYKHGLVSQQYLKTS